MDYDALSDKELWDLTTDEDGRVRLESLYNICLRLNNRGAAAEIISPALAGIAAAVEEEDSTLQFDLCLVLGRSLMSLGRHAEALQHLLDAAEIARIHLGESALADCIMSIGSCQTTLGDLVAAEESWRSAASLFLSDGNETRSGIALLELGQLMGRQERQNEGLEVFTEALTTFQSAGDLIGSGRAYDRIAACLIDLGDVATAIEKLREAHNIFSYTNDEGRLPWAQYRLGWTLVTFGNNEEAIPLLTSASDAYKRRGDFVSAANADTQLAHAYYELGRVDEALELYATVRSVFQAAGETTDALIADVNNARRIRYSEKERAIEILSRVVEEGTESGDTWIVRNANLRLAEYHLDYDNITGAQQALEILSEVAESAYGDNLPDQIRHKTTVAKASFLVGDRKTALKLATELSELAKDSGFQYESANGYEILAMAAELDGNEDDANRYFSHAIALYLAAGMKDTATKLSQRFLPDDQAAVLDAPLHKSESQSRNDEES